MEEMRVRENLVVAIGGCLVFAADGVHYYGG